MIRQSYLLAAALAGATLVHAQPVPGRAPAASWLDSISVSASATATSVDNISRTSHSPTRKDATTYELGLSASRHQQLTSDWQLDLGADVNWLNVPKYDLAGHFEAGPRVTLQHKFGLGSLAPVLQFNGRLSYKDARLAADQGWTTEGGVRLAKRLNSSLRVALSGQWFEHNAASATFDLQQRTVGLEALWDITDKWRLSGTVSRLSGRIVANAAWPIWAQAIGGAFGPTVFNYYNSIPWEETHIYGPRWVSYNVEATADLWSLTLGYALTDRSSLELRTDSAHVVNHIDIHYPTESWGLGFSHRF